MTKSNVKNNFNYHELKALHRTLRNDFDEQFSIRIHRALSWLERAERETNDPDAGFLFNWISFNANYSIKQDFSNKVSEGQKFRDFFHLIIEVDEDNLVYSSVWSHFTNEIRSILNNEFIYANFWHIEDQGPAASWRKGFEDSKLVVNKALTSQNTEVILQILFSRLYTLRNQLVHGNATWNGKVNRQQVVDGYKLISHLQPIFIYLMLKNPNHNWGHLAFPIVDMDI